MFFTKKLTKKFAIDIDLFSKGWSFFDLSLDFNLSKKSDHSPSFHFAFHLFHIIILTIDFYNMNHKTEDGADSIHIEYICPTNPLIKGYVYPDDKYVHAYKGFSAFIESPKTDGKYSGSKDSLEVFKTKEEAENWLSQNW